MGLEQVPYVVVGVVVLGLYLWRRSYRRRHPPTRTPQEVWDAADPEMKKGISFSTPWNNGGP